MITLTTDFGGRDPFVGIMKGVILGAVPDARVVDLTHGIPMGDIRAAAVALGSALPYFPEGTVHVAVVDPKVGSDRKALVAECNGQTFVAPDNGLLPWAFDFARLGGAAFTSVENRAAFPGPLSSTFHGRDVFAPVAARIAGGEKRGWFGPAFAEPVRLHFPKPAEKSGRVTGEILYCDGFGNLLSNIHHEDVNAAYPGWETGEAVVGERTVPLVNTYSDRDTGTLLALFSSAGYLELSVNLGSALEVLGGGVGTTVVFRPSIARR
jgi:S-adenosylmethionine hydrolase